MLHTTRHSRALGCIALSLLALTALASADGTSREQDFTVLLDRYDREPTGPAREALALRVDAAAHQRYATVSRLYWHTDLAAAKDAARRTARPILHLRMLGRLDEELSCANSRLFRTTLYANQELSRFLREQFVLVWSTERPVPRVTIDYGDGRTLERTTTGNSAHYVLDEDGNVLDVLPGLYAPSAFRRELTNSLVLAAQARGVSEDERSRLVAAYQRQLALSAGRDWARLAGSSWVLGERQLLTAARLETALAAAQRATMSKARIEVPDLQRIVGGVSPESIPLSQIEMWSALGQRLYGIGDLENSSAAPPRVLDDTSRALVERLHNALPIELRSVGGRLDMVIARLEQMIVADTALNQLRLRPTIAREIARRSGRAEFAPLNAWIYAQVFHTPKEDAWLGLLPRDVFTALPGDGVVMKRD